MGGACEIVLCLRSQGAGQSVVKIGGCRGPGKERGGVTFKLL